MASVSTYLNFMGTTEEAFRFYEHVFQSKIEAIDYMRNVPREPGQPELPDDEKDKVMHVSLPILNGHRLMGTDVVASMNRKLLVGNNVSINLEPDSREETERLFRELSAGGSDIMELQEMFWGDLFGACVDKFGVCWMFNFTLKKTDG